MLPLGHDSDANQRRGIGARAPVPSPAGEASAGRGFSSQVVLPQRRRVSTMCSLTALNGRLSSSVEIARSSTFLHPFAPRPLRRFVATMNALTPAGPVLRTAPGGPEHRPNTQQVSRVDLPDLPAIPPPTTWCARPSLYHATPQRGRLPCPTGGSVWVSPFASRLTATPGRIEFVILRTGRSPSVALHPASRRRSYGWLQTGVRLSGEDSHLPDRVNYPSH